MFTVRKAATGGRAEYSPQTIGPKPEGKMN